MLRDSRYFIGIDIGASFIKGALFDLQKLAVTNIIKFSSPALKSRKNLRFEINCDLHEKSVKKIINNLLIKQRDISGITFCTQMHGMVLVDEKLNQLTPFIGWQDGRLHKKATGNKTWFDVLRGKLRNIELSNTGIKYRSGLMGSTLFWLSESRFLKKNGKAKALFLGDYIAAKISNGKTLVDSTNACGSGLFNTKKNIWNEKILKALKIDKSYLPNIVPTGSVVGYLKKSDKKIPVFVSTGDLQTAVLGSQIGLKKEKDFCINIGTGSQISCVSDNFSVGDYDIRSYFDNTFLNTIAFIPAGRALNVIIKFIEDIEDRIYEKKNPDVWEKIVKLISDKKTSEGIVANVSYYENSISKTGGSFENVLESNWSIENIFFSVLEGMTENYWKAYRRLEKSEKKYRIVCAGGLIRKLERLRFLLEGKFKRKIYLSRYEEETLTGLFILSLVYSGSFSTVKDASLFVQKNRLKF